MMRQEILQQISDCINGKSTIQEFEAWMLSNLGVILNSGDGELIDMANDIDADFIGLSEGTIDEETLRKRLLGYFTEGETLHLVWGAE